MQLTNTSTQPLTLTLSHASEITLAPQAADEAHPAFSNLFVRAHWHEEDHALYLQRQPRLADEATVYACVFLAGRQ